MATAPVVIGIVVGIAFSSPLLLVANVVASRLDLCRNFLRVITKYLSGTDEGAYNNGKTGKALCIPPVLPLFVPFFLP